jgi:hypothetical protein
MMRIVLFAIAVLINPATAAAADPLRCGQPSELAAARTRWAAARRTAVDPAPNEKSCRSYGIHFYEAVAAREVASMCRNGIDRQRTLDVLDSEIDAFNDLIATRCGS